MIMSYSIPLFKLNFDDAEIKAVTETIQSQWISTGPKCEELERNFSEFIDVPFALSLSNCTSALHLAMKILDIGIEDEVICPSLTFAASVNSIRYVNAIPVFCDIISNEDLNIDPVKAEKLITPKTKAILAVHFAGFPCDMTAISELAGKYNLKIIEDASHAPGSEYGGRKLGSIGDVACFSFFSNKNISTGEGGVLLTKNEELYNRAKLLRSHGMTTMSYQRALGHATEYDIAELGYNFRMDDMRASIGIVQLNKLPEDLDKRQIIRQKYLNMLSQNNNLIIPFAKNTEFVTNYIFPVILKNSNKQKRDAVRHALHDAGIQTSIHYPAIHRFSVYKDYTKSLPITEYVSDNEITLPIFGTLTDDEIEYICDKLEEITRK